MDNLFLFGKNLISNEMYGLGLIFIFISIVLFFLLLFNLVIKFNLLSKNEVDEVKIKSNVILAIEEKEKKYFLSGDYIDDDDLAFMFSVFKKIFILF